MVSNASCLKWRLMCEQNAAGFLENSAVQQKDEAEEGNTDSSQLRLLLWEGCGWAEPQEALWFVILAPLVLWVSPAPQSMATSISMMFMMGTEVDI